MLNDLVGQENLKSALKGMVDASRRAKRALDHMLLVGERGMGKAAFVQAAANERGVQLRTATLDALNDSVELVNVLTSMPINGVLFIQDVTQLSPNAGQVLTRFVTEAEQEILVGMATAGRSATLRLPPFTVIGTAEHMPTIPAQVYRNVRVFVMEPYARQQLQEIVLRAASSAGRSMDGRAAELVAMYSEGKPFQALSLFRHLCRHISDSDRINLTTARRALTELGYS